MSTREEIQRRLGGARRIDDSGGLEATQGELVEPGVAISWGGACPVQGYGIVDGQGCYYRSRGEGWQFHVARAGTAGWWRGGADEEFRYGESPYAWPDGGWVPAAVSAACIRRAVAAWRAQRTPTLPERER